MAEESEQQRSEREAAREAAREGLRKAREAREALEALEASREGLREAPPPPFGAAPGGFVAGARAYQGSYEQASHVGQHAGTFLAEDELRELEPFTALHDEALGAFIRTALANQVFIRQAYAEGGEFLLRKADGRFHRVTFL